MRSAVSKFMNQPWISPFILSVIVLNAIVLGLQTAPSIVAATGGALSLIDNICLGIFTVELLLKMFAQGPRFFKGGWNIFDFIIVGIALAPGSGGLSVLRALRILRVLRVISIAPRLRRVVEGFIRAMPGMASVFLLMTIIFYIGAVMATKLFGEVFPQWFGTIGESAYSLFQIMTLESWSMGIVRPVMEEFPQAWAFFVPFIMSTTFAVVNLIVGLVVNSMQEANEVESVAATDQYRDDVLGKLAEISARLDAMEKSTHKAG
ncbi:MAG: ion transporter [Paracoccaceae bacterium]